MTTTSAERPKLRVVILTGLESGSVLDAISAVASLPDVSVVGILFDSDRPTYRRRMRNLRRNIRREGMGYIGFRIAEAIREQLEQFAASVVPHEEVARLLQLAFPSRRFHVKDFERFEKIPVRKVGNLNGLPAAEALRELNVDLGIVIGTRVLKRSTFSVPRMGCINVHKGKVPEYRGMPPGFWELYDGQQSAGITIHFVDDGLDTGDIVGADSVAIEPSDSLQTLQMKLDMLAQELLVRCVASIATGTSSRTKQPLWTGKPRTSPSRAQRYELQVRRRQGRAPASILVSCIKTLAYLVMYFCGVLTLVRTMRRLFGNERASIILYHHVNAQCADTLATSPERFAEHVAILKKSYVVIDSATLVRKIRDGERIPGGTVVMQFDDCHRDVLIHAAPILREAGMRAGLFVSTGFVNTSRAFAHDIGAFPSAFENLTGEDLRRLDEMGWEIGSHTVNHADLGRATTDEAQFEIVQSKKDLEAILHKPINLFSCPFIGTQNTRPEIARLVCEAGYAAMFSGYDGYVDRRTDRFNIPRIGASGHFRPLDLVMAIEGLSLNALRDRTKGMVGSAPQPSLSDGRSGVP
jgi:peptidoglycan/xylan/chitin deacetylase (PgdA/CDA1 family)